AVHPGLAGADDPAEAGGAELERPREALAELGARPRVRARPIEQALELGPGLGIGIVGDPALGACEEVAHRRLFYHFCLASASAKAVSYRPSAKGGAARMRRRNARLVAAGPAGPTSSIVVSARAWSRRAI